MWLLALFIAVPLIEIALFIQIGGAIGLWPTLGVVVVTAILGTWLVRAQGLQTLAKLRGSLNELSDPTEPLVHGAMILFAGALLLTPGFFTDAVGFALLVPAVRSAVFTWLRARVRVQSFTIGGATQDRPPPRPSRQGPVIDGEFEDVTPQNPPKPGTSGWTRH